MLDLSGCHLLSDDGISSVVAACPALTSLSLSSCKRVTDASLAALGRHCHVLERLSLCGVDAITDAGLMMVSDGARWASLHVPMHILCTAHHARCRQAMMSRPITFESAQNAGGLCG